MKIPEKIIDAVNELPVRDVVEEYSGIQLNSRGFGESPFRNEGGDTSFSVSDSRNLFTDWKLKAAGYCGGPIKFVQLYKKIGFRDAVIDLAAKYSLITAEEVQKMGFSNKIVVTDTPRTIVKRDMPVLATLAPVEQLDKVYRAIIELSPLNTEHQKILSDRGFTEEEIKARKFFSLPTKAIVRKLEKFGISNGELEGVPGFYKTLKDDERFTFMAQQGIGIPCFNAEGFCVGLQRRSTESNPSLRYSWISSARADGLKGKGDKIPGFYGCGPGTPIDYHPNGEKLLITEGIFKSIAVAREKDWNFSIASVQGVGNWKGIQKILEVHSEVAIAYDSDLIENPQVCQQVELLADYVKGITGNIPEILYWKQEYGKGIDDVLFAGNKPHIHSVPFTEWQDIFSSARKVAAIEGIDFKDAFNRFF